VPDPEEETLIVGTKLAGEFADRPADRPCEGNRDRPTPSECRGPDLGFERIAFSGPRPRDARSTGGDTV
jgi:hypothetical protein